MGVEYIKQQSNKYNSVIKQIQLLAISIYVNSIDIVGMEIKPGINISNLIYCKKHELNTFFFINLAK
jgi:hypothetical protein